MNSEELIKELEDIQGTCSTDQLYKAVEVAIDAMQIAQTIMDNIHHTQIEVIDDCPTGNVYIGMADEDYMYVCDLIKHINYVKEKING